MTNELKPPWRAMETAPLDGTNVDLWMLDKVAGLQWRQPDAEYSQGQWVFYDEDARLRTVGYIGIQFPVAWMPVPEGP